MSDFQAFPPSPIEITIAGEALAITPIRIGEIPALMAAIRPFIGPITSANPDWFALLADHGDGVISAVSVASRKPKPWVEVLTSDEAIRLATLLVEVNADFFVTRVVPAIQQAAARINTLGILSTGPRPSTC